MKKKVPITVKVSTAYFVCSIIQRCLSFITLPLFTRLLSPAEYGQYTVYSSWSAMLSIFLTLNLAYGSFSTAMIKFEEDRDGYISSVQGINLLLSAIFLLIYLPFNDLWNKLFDLPTFFVVLMVLEIVAQTATLLWSGKKRFEFKYISVILVTLMISFCAPVLAYFLVISSEEKGYARIIGFVAVTVAVGTIIWWINQIRGKHLFNKEYWKYALSFNLPLLIYYLSQVVFNQSDCIMISHMSGKGDVALYGVAYSLAMALTFVINAINNSYVPWLYEKLKVGEQKENAQISLILVILLALMILAVIWYAPEIIRIMAGEKYISSQYVVAPVAMSLLLLFYVQLFINIEFYYEEKKALVIASVGSAILNIALNYLLIPVFGYVVAGYTTLISYIVFVLCNYIAMKKILLVRKIKDNMYNYKALFIVFILFMASGFLGVALYSHLLIRIIITILVLSIMIFKRNVFIGAIKGIKNAETV